MANKQLAQSFQVSLILIGAFVLSGCVAISPSPLRQQQFSLHQAAPLFELKGQPTRILDGDTFDLLSTTHEVSRIRLKGIDAPEKTQPFGEAAKQYLSQLIADRTVTVLYSSKDKYGRLIGKVQVGNGADQRDVCLAMVAAGYAWHYKAYEKEQSEDNRTKYAEAETTAKEKRRGLWNTTVTPIPPWDYRHPSSAKDLTMSDSDNNHYHSTDDALVDRTLRDMAETAFYAELSDLELIRAVRDTEALSDHPCVFELINRLNPGWQTDLSNADPNKPSFISIAVPIYPARDTVCYDRCHCIEDGQTDDRTKPCVHCALKASLFKNTKDELYRPRPVSL